MSSPFLQLPGSSISRSFTRFVLQPIDGETTRLLLREPVPSTFGARTLNAIMWDPMHFVMQQRMLRGIKERAEGRPLVPDGILSVARIGWILATAGLLAIFVIRRRWRLWSLVPTVSVLPVLQSTGDWDAALAGFLAIGITLAGALVFGRRWWPPYPLVATAVALVLLLAPDAYAALGVVFAAVWLAVPAVLLPGIAGRPTAHQTNAG